MDKSYYKRYYSLERNHWWFRVRKKIIEHRMSKIIPRGKDLKILNLGVATGYTSQWLASFGEVTSLEYDKDICQFLAEELKLKNVVNASVLDIPFPDNTYDIVCAFDVIEHVEHDHKAVEEIIRVCKEGGWIIITVPALMMLWSNHDVVNHHYRRYRKSSLLRLLQQFSVRIKYHSYFNSLLFGPILMTRLTSRMLDRKTKGSTSDFDVYRNSLFDRVFYIIFSMEYHLLKIFRFPIGVSIIGVFQKK